MDNGHFWGVEVGKPIQLATLLPLPLLWLRWKNTIELATLLPKMTLLFFRFRPALQEGWIVIICNFRKSRRSLISVLWLFSCEFIYFKVNVKAPRHRVLFMSIYLNYKGRSTFGRQTNEILFSAEVLDKKGIVKIIKNSQRIWGKLFTNVLR